MDWALFVPGAAGALVTVYLAAKEVVPEFPPLIDVATKEEELVRRQKRIQTTELEIDESQKELRSDPPISNTRLERLSKHLDTSREEVDADRTRVQQLEKDVAWSQRWSRTIGFIVYVVLGGVFAALVASNVEVQGRASGFEGTFADGVKAFVIGGAWTSFLATIGYQSGSNKVDRQLQSARQDALARIKSLEEEIDDVFKSELEEVSREPDAGKRKEGIRQSKRRLDTKSRNVRSQVGHELESLNRNVGRARGRLL